LAHTARMEGENGGKATTEKGNQVYCNMEERKSARNAVWLFMWPSADAISLRGTESLLIFAFLLKTRPANFRRC
jgi:hypothetical protein